MNLDDLQFENDEDRRRYLADLAKLKRYREEAKKHPATAKPDASLSWEKEKAEPEDWEAVDLPWDEEVQEKVLGNSIEMIHGEDITDRIRASRRQTVSDEKMQRKDKPRRKEEPEVYVPQNVRDERPEPEERNRKEKKKKKHPVLIILLVLILAGAGWVGYNYFFGHQGHYTVVVFGLDSRNGNVGKEALSDVNIIADIDMKTGEIKLASIYRDTYVKIGPDGPYHKFNEAYFRGGPERAVWTTEHNLDLKVDDYAAFNWKAVVDTINILGGVDIEITDAEFKYINGFITETVNSTGIGSVQLEHAGMNHLDGIQAVAYARLRLMDTDYQRTRRQRQVIQLAFEKAKKADFKTLVQILRVVLPQTNTSITVDDMIPFARFIKLLHLGGTCGFPYEKKAVDVAGKDCVVAVTLESNVRALHAFLWPDREYVPSQEMKEISSRIADETGLYAEGTAEIKTDE